MSKIWQIAAIVLPVPLALGVIYERAGGRRDQAKLPRVGRAVDVGGRALNISCLGEGAPAVILDAGGSAPGFSNLPLQRLISSETKTCWFDRAGLGWSDPSSALQTSGAIASDLHNLLRGAGIAPPFILVGQSFSGFNVRMFAARDAHKVAGIVLLDSVHEDQQQYEPRSALAPVNRLPAAARNLLCKVVPWAAKVGMVRLMVDSSGGRRPIPGFTAAEAATLQALEAQPKAVVAAAGCQAWERSADEARAAGTLGNIPLYVLTAGEPMRTGDPAVDQELKQFHDIWVHKLQVQLAGLSTCGKQVIVENSSHDGGRDMAHAAVRAIREILRESHR